MYKIYISQKLKCFGYACILDYCSICNLLHLFAEKDNKRGNCLPAYLVVLYADHSEQLSVSIEEDGSRYRPNKRPCHSCSIIVRMNIVSFPT